MRVSAVFSNFRRRNKNSHPQQSFFKKIQITVRAKINDKTPFQFHQFGKIMFNVWSDLINRVPWNPSTNSYYYIHCIAPHNCITSIPPVPCKINFNLENKSLLNITRCNRILPYQFDKRKLFKHSNRLCLHSILLTKNFVVLVIGHRRSSTLC